MNIFVANSRKIPINQTVAEYVERKGEGHPDTLSDFTADIFVNNYIKKCWEKFTILEEHKKFPNLYADKINLAGAISNAQFGSFEIIEPVEAFLIGKVTKSVGKEKIEIDKIFEDSVFQVLHSILKHEDVSSNVNFYIKNNNLGGADHQNGFYNPSSQEQLLSILEKESLANDTTIVTGYAPLSDTETLAIYLERAVNSSRFKGEFPFIGTDVKVLIARFANDYDITMCLPFHPELTHSVEFYYRSLSQVKEYLYNCIEEFMYKQHIKSSNINLSINTKDKGDRVYLAPWGTALSKGDCGVVGRGNKYNGVISVSRPSSVEAPAGKNPNHFAGKIYTAIAQSISEIIYGKLNLENQTTIISKNGGNLENPAKVFVETVEDISLKQESEIKEIINHELRRVEDYKLALISTCPIDRFRNGKLNLKNTVSLI
ncbi:methionine adenosyltransferase [Bacillus thuringiensis]|uniref:methionine adenosyltransferase n=1 Tax=Bacillus thuringiensis TaxID=1428 RepID=UPI0011A37E7B|nr:methionine adenosyltransferase [Bacillus thuringiensis]